MPIDRVIADVESALRDAGSPNAACEAVVIALGRHTTALIAGLLHVRDHLRCVAATGSWHVYSSVPADHGIVGRVFGSGRTATITDVATDPDYIPLGPQMAVEICAPLIEPTGSPIGVLNVEWTTQINVAMWQPIVEQAARQLAVRIHELGGPPAETRSEQLLRHALSLTAATDEAQLLDRSIEAARDVSGLRAAVLLLATATGVKAYRGPAEPGSFDERLGRHLSTADPGELAALRVRARGHGASYTLNDPASHDAHGFELLTEAGVRTMIAVPAGPTATGGVLLVVDEVATKPSPATVNLLELLAAHAWTAVQRIRTLRQLHARASSDPLTGLGHHGPFGERLAAAAPGKTALLAIDVDAFKTVNDTYGHQVGDRVLVDLARALQQALRESDDLFRVGGDEFVAVLEVHSADEASGVAQRLCEAARKTGRTISVGVAIQGDREAPESALRRADAALYEAKRAGRDGFRPAG